MTAEQLYHEHSGWIYGYCLRVLRSPDEAEEALQTTFVNACRSLNQGTRPKVGSAWLLRIAKNVCFARLRASGRRSKLERVQDMTILEETAAAPDRPPDDLIGLTDALVRMPRQQRRAILLREWQGLSYSEVADQLGLTRSAAEALIFRARRSLAAELEDPGKSSKRRSLRAIDLGGFAAALKGAFAGSAGVKTVAALTVAAATTTVVATDPAHVWRDRQAPVQPEARVQAADSRPTATRPFAIVTPVVAPAETAWPAVEPAASPAGRGRLGKATPKENNAGGKGTAKATGKANAPGQIKKADGTTSRSRGRGAASPQGAASPDETGPPAHAPAKGLAKAKAKEKRAR